MNNPIVIILVVIGCVAAVFWFVIKPRIWKDKTATGSMSTPGITIPPNIIKHPRVDGGNWYSLSPVDEALRPIIGQVIIDGLAEMIVAVKYHNPSWTRYLNTADYEVWCIAPMATNQDGSPALLVSGVQSAGTVMNVGPGWPPFNPPIILLPEQAPDWKYLEYLKNSVHNEGEHCIEWMNDQKAFYGFTGAYDVHPHWSAPPPIGGEAA